MKLDFIVTEYDETTNNGKFVQIRKDLANFSDDGYIMTRFGLGNHEGSMPYAYFSSQFLSTLANMRNYYELYADKSEKKQLESAINTLQHFINKEHITDDNFKRAFAITKQLTK